MPLKYHLLFQPEIKLYFYMDKVSISKANFCQCGKAFFFPTVDLKKS